MQFGFQHQTLFSHARARAVVHGNIDLCDFVVARQHALFVRPTLWTVLGYLRDAARETYSAQMAKLCSEPLRLHIRHLLLDFLGRLHNPDDFEEAWLVNWLEDDDFRRRALLSISGSSEWFSRLKDSHITELMRDPQGTEWQLVGLLSNAINLSPKATLALMGEYWLKDPAKDEFTFRVFVEFAHWSEESVAAVCRIVERTTINEALVTRIASNVADDKPELAPRIPEALERTAAYPRSIGSRHARRRDARRSNSRKMDMRSEESISKSNRIQFRAIPDAVDRRSSPTSVFG
jgi:hypothetical protein